MSAVTNSGNSDNSQAKPSPEDVSSNSTTPSSASPPAPSSAMNTNSSSFRLLLLFFMVVQNSSVVLVGRYTRASKTEDELFVVNHLIIITEALKFVFANIFEYQTTGGKLIASLKENVFDNPLDCIKILIPSLLYLLQNSLLYVALSNLSAPLFQVTYQAKLLTTAIVSVIMLDRRYSIKQWICLTALGFGVAVVVLGESMAKKDSSEMEEEAQLTDVADDKPPQSLFVGLVAVTIACFSSALAGVYFEKVLKKPPTFHDKTKKPVSLWMRNIQMAFFSVCIGLIQYYNLNEHQGGNKPFMFGFTGWVWTCALLQAGGGLLVAAVIKYADNVLKGMATGVSVVVATACSMVLFDTPLTVQFSFGALIILASVYLFSNEIPCLKKKVTVVRAADEEMQKPLINSPK